MADYGADTLSYATFRLAVIVAGFVGNMVFMSFIINNKIGSSVSMIFVWAQTVLDGSTCLMAIGYNLPDVPFYWLTGVVGFDLVLCYLWHSGTLIYIIMCISIYILILVAMDRFISIVYPFVYRRKQNKHAYIGLAVVILLNLIFVIPSKLATKYRFANETTNASCYYDTVGTPVFNEFLVVHSYMVYGFIFLLPLCVTSVLYAAVVYSLRKLTAMSETREQNRQIGRKFTLASIIINICFCICLAFNSTLYLFYQVGIIGFYYDTLLDVTSEFFVYVNFMVNPVVYFMIFKNFRQFIRNKICFFAKPNEPTKAELTENEN